MVDSTQVKPLIEVRHSREFQMVSSITKRSVKEVVKGLEDTCCKHGMDIYWKPETEITLVEACSSSVTGGTS